MKRFSIIDNNIKYGIVLTEKQLVSAKLENLLIMQKKIKRSTLKK